LDKISFKQERHLIMTPPQSFLNHLQTSGYHPRSNKHSNALGEAIVADLLATCPSIARRAAAGDIVYSLNFDLHYATAQWNVDLVIGPPPANVATQLGGAPILCAAPSTVQIAIELKTVMTEHRKAIKNRKRDMEAHHEHVHNYDARTIAGGVMVINASPTFRSALRAPGQITTHSQIGSKVQHCMNEVRAISVRGGPTGYGLDAMTAIIVDMDNVNLTRTSYVTKAPAPQVGDPLNYDAFIQRLCSEYRGRFGQ
jgi:hypothetical protein